MKTATKCQGLERINKFAPEISEWFEARGLKPPPQETLSDMGYMADGRVAAWLYITNSSVAMIENIISDPNTVPSLRRQSLDKLIGFLVDTATALGYTTVLGITKHKGVLNLAQRFGFKEMKDYKLVVLTTGDE